MLVQFVGFTKQPGGELVAAGQLDQQRLIRIISRIDAELQKIEPAPEAPSRKRGRMVPVSPIKQPEAPQ